MTWTCIQLLAFMSVVTTSHIALVNLATETVPTPWIAQSLVNKALYATHHGYTLLVYPRQDTDRPHSWSKIKTIRQAILSERYDWLFWLDSDTVITNFTISVESILPSERHVHFILGLDCNGVNMGVMLIRSSSLALGVLERVYHGKHVTDDSIRNVWWEQYSFHQILAKDDEVVNMTKVVPQHVFNAYPDDLPCVGNGSHPWAPGDFIIHMPSLSHERRNDLVVMALNNVSH